MFLAHSVSVLLFFFFNDTATTEIYTLSLHDALPICLVVRLAFEITQDQRRAIVARQAGQFLVEDRKSTRLNSSHLLISYAVFCLKKKKDKIVLNYPLAQPLIDDMTIARNILDPPSGE